MEVGDVQTQTHTLAPTTIAVSVSNVPIPVSSELSNVSSTGSVSDREPETSEKSIHSKSVKTTPERKPPRKRKRNEDHQPKCDRKITECFKVQFFSFTYV